MLSRLYYSVPNAEVAEACYTLAQELDLAEGHFSVISYEIASLEVRHIPVADYFKSLDLLRCSLYGLGYGLLSGGAMLGLLTLMTPYESSIAKAYFWIPVAVTACFGLWGGAMTGLAKTNHHLSPFRSKLKRGNAIVMIDVTEDMKPIVEQLIKQRVPEARLEKRSILGEGVFDQTG